LRCSITIPFGDARSASSVLGAVEPERGFSPSGRTRVSVRREGSSILLDVVSEDITSRRAAINSYLRWLILGSRMAEMAGDG
jgi:tRNA threonylcarbamoyladenosine modification (KEOPS) complex  Pcc1 subunit